MSTRGEIWIPKNSREMTILRIEHSAYPERMKRELEGRTPEQLLRLVDRQGAGSMAAKKRRGIYRSTVRRIDFDWTRTLLNGDADFAWYRNPATGAWDSIRRNQMNDPGFVMGVVHGLVETGGQRFEESSGNAQPVSLFGHDWPSMAACTRDLKFTANAIRKVMDGTADPALSKPLKWTVEAWARGDRSNRWYPHESTEGFDKYLTDTDFRRAYKKGLVDGDGRLTESAMRDAPRGRSPWFDGEDFIKSGKDWDRMKIKIRRGDSKDYPYVVVEADGVRSIPRDHVHMRYKSYDDAWTFMKSVKHFNAIEVERRRG